MFRANRPRGEGVPANARESQPTSTSIESLLAVGLCVIVALASMALLRRSSDYSRALVELQIDSLATGRRKVRAPGNPSPAEPRPDLVILVALDALRADHLELYGYGRPTAPRLRCLGEEGIVFRTVCAQAAHPLTSHKSLLTGKYPATLMLEQTGADALELSSLADPGAYLERTFSRVEGRLAAGFREHGYRTAAFTDGGWTGREAGFEHGFAVFDEEGGGLDALLPRALAWLEHNAAEPSFLFVRGGDLACPYSARSPFAEAFCPDHSTHPDLALCCEPRHGGSELASSELDALLAHYDGALAAADNSLERFFDELRARGLYERALIVLTSGHGESLGERGVIGHGGLYLEQLLVPLILKFPQAWNLQPLVVTESVELVDVLPTLFALCGFPAEKDLDGRSLLPLLRGVRGRAYTVAQSSFEEVPSGRSNPVQRTLLRPGRWQVIQDSAHSQASLFVLQHDPQALRALPIAAEEFSALLDVLLGRPAARAYGAAPVHFGADIESELGQLGYGTAALAGQSAGTALR